MLVFLRCTPVTFEVGIGLETPIPQHCKAIKLNTSFLQNFAPQTPRHKEVSVDLGTKGQPVFPLLAEIPDLRKYGQFRARASLVLFLEFYRRRKKTEF